MGKFIASRIIEIKCQGKNFLCYFYLHVTDVRSVAFFYFEQKNFMFPISWTLLETRRHCSKIIGIKRLGGIKRYKKNSKKSMLRI